MLLWLGIRDPAPRSTPHDTSTVPHTSTWSPPAKALRWRDLTGFGRSATAGGIAWGSISLIAFVVARTSGGWFGFTDQPGLNPAPEAAIAVISESVTVALALALLVAEWTRRER